MKTSLRSIFVFLATLFLCGFSCHAQQAVPIHGVTLTWQASPTVTVDQYQVSRGTVAGGPYPIAACVVIAPLLTCFDKAPAGGPYFYVVQAHDPVSGWSPVSVEANTTGKPVPANTGVVPAFSLLVN